MNRRTWHVAAAVVVVVAAAPQMSTLDKRRSVRVPSGRDDRGHPGH
jgi:hypothetical protein